MKMNILPNEKYVKYISAKNIHAMCTLHKNWCGTNLQKVLSLCEQIWLRFIVLEGVEFPSLALELPELVGVHIPRGPQQAALAHVLEALLAHGPAAVQHDFL